MARAAPSLLPVPNPSPTSADAPIGIFDSGFGGLGDLWFVPHAQWAPPLGLTFWAVEGGAATLLLGVTWWRLLGRPPEEGASHPL